MNLATLIADIRLRDAALGAWCALADESAPNPALDADFHDGAAPLAGVTVGIKDIIDIAGLPTRCGSRIYDHAAPVSVDAACVSLLRAAGALIVGKTVTTELATFVPAGTRNPAAPDCTPGGSSAGSAAAVAAGQVRIALGTQTAGSILRPAAYCGVVGFKPTFGTVPRTGTKVQCESLDTVGVFARHVEDCARWWRVMMGDAVFSTEGLPALLRVACLDDPRLPADTVMRAALAAFADSLRAAGHHVVSATLPLELYIAIDAQQTIQAFESARAYCPERTVHRAGLTPALAEYLDRGAAISWADYRRALAVAADARAAAGRWLASVDCVALPAAPGFPPLLAADSTGDPLFNRLASVLHLPAISLPLVGDGPPLGVQLIGRADGDAALLRQASQLQRTCRALKPPLPNHAP